MVGKISISRRIFLICNAVVFFLVILACILPVLHVVFASLSDPVWVMGKNGLIWHIHGFNLEGYRLVLTNNTLLTSYLNTFIYVIAGTAIGMLVTVMGAYVLSRPDFLWKNIIMFLVTFTMLFSGGIIPLYLVVTKTLHLFDSRWAVIFPSCITAFNLIIMRTAISSLPPSMEESAMLDGAGRMTILFRIIIPLVKASVATVILYYAVSHWNSWFYASIFLRTRSKYPLQLVLKEILITSDGASSAVSAGEFAEDTILYKQLFKYCAIVLSTIPVFVFYPFIQKYFEAGVMIGAIKE